MFGSQNAGNGKKTSRERERDRGKAREREKNANRGKLTVNDKVEEDVEKACDVFVVRQQMHEKNTTETQRVRERKSKR